MTITILSGAGAGSSTGSFADNDLEGFISLGMGPGTPPGGAVASVDFSEGYQFANPRVSLFAQDALTLGIGASISLNKTNDSVTGFTINVPTPAGRDQYNWTYSVKG